MIPTLVLAIGSSLAAPSRGLALGSPAGTTSGAATLHAVTIANEAVSPGVEFALSASSHAEASGSVLVSVELSALAATDISLPFTVAGTAVDPDDYGVSASPLVLPAGSLSADIVVTLVDNQLFERDKTVEFTLASPAAGATLGTNSVHVLTILDDEPLPTAEFGQASASALETDAVVVVGVTLTTPAPSHTSIPLTFGGTAVEGEDFTVTTNEIFIPSGMVTGSYEIQIIDDGFAEPDETLILTMGAPGNGTLLGISEFTLTIENDDFGQVDIHEFMASNSMTLLDEDGDSSDWIELNNSLSVPVDLTGWHLTDDSAALDKWTFPATTLMPGEFLVVFASNKERAVSGQELHTNFKLGASGEYLALTDANNNVVSEYAPEYPAQSTDNSYGLIDGTLTEAFFSTPTPRAPNVVLGAPLEPVVFSVQRGYYEAAQTLALSHATVGAEIRYTLDGSRPSIEDGLLYSEPLQVDGTTIVRASAFATGFAPSIPATQTYLFYGDVFEQSQAGAIAAGFPSQWIDEAGSPWTAAVNGTHPGAWYGLYESFVQALSAVERRGILDEIPSVSLTMPVDDWFGFDPVEGKFGIYVNSLASSDFYDRNGSIEWIDPTGGPEFADGVQFSIQGSGSTRPQARNQLSIAMKFRSDEGSDMLDFQVFEDSEVDKYEYLVLDAGSQNSVNALSHFGVKRHAQGLRDFFSTELGRTAGFPEAHSRFVHVYINGLHWGVYLLHERQDDDFGSTHFGGAPEEWDNLRHGTIRNGNTNPADHPTAPGLWPTVLDIAAGGVGPRDVWRGLPAYDELAARVDLKSYANYVARNLYVGNRDWAGTNWIAIAHARLSGDLTDVNPDARFEFYSWDAENTLQANALANLVEDGVWDRSSETSTNERHVLFLHTALIENKEYLTLFMDEVWRMMRPGGALHVDPNFAAFGTPFDPNFPERNRPAALYHALSLELEPVIAMEYARWGHYAGTSPPIELSDWQAERKRLLEEYFPIRTNVFLQQLRSGAVALMPHLDAPTFSQLGGTAPFGTEITLSGSPSAQIYYTLDGTDPRVAPGLISSSAIVYTGAIALDQSFLRIRARQLEGSQWGPIESYSFLAGAESIVINEFSADNSDVILDEAGEADDWIELFNNASHAVDLSGWGLSDDAGEPDKWTFPEGTMIGPQEYLLVWADKDLDQGPLHADFSLSKNGEEVVLSLMEEFEFKTVDSTVFGPLPEDHSRGRFPNGTGRFYTMHRPTPERANRRVYTGRRVSPPAGQDPTQAR